MGYYDGNTTTALWHIAQNFAMNDNSYGTTFGPSSVGAINLISGQTNGVTQTLNGTGDETDGGAGSLTVIGDPDPIGDVCSISTRNQVTWAARISATPERAEYQLGLVRGGIQSLHSESRTGPLAATAATPPTFTGVYRMRLYSSPFRRSSITLPRPIQTTRGRLPFHHRQNGDAAIINTILTTSLRPSSAGNFPAVSFLKALGIQDGHAGYSGPLDEQQFVFRSSISCSQRPDWSSTAVVITYDDSDGWYDHQIGPIVNQSTGSADALTGPDACGNGNTALPGVASDNPHALGRCGYGPRLPLLVVSPLREVRTLWTIPLPTRLRSSASSKTTGWAASARDRVRLTPSPVRSPICSTSAISRDES